MTGWLIYDKKQFEKNGWFANELFKNCSLFCEMRLILAERLLLGTDGEKCFFEYDSEPLPAPDFAVNRSIFPLLSLTLEKSNVRVFNTFETSSLCNDKRKTHLAVLSAGVPTMKTAFFEKDFFENENALSFGFPCVLKAASGHGGKEVFLLKSPKELERCLNLLPSKSFLLQKPCRSSRDVRAYVLGGKIIGAVLRTPEKGSFKSNFSLGSRVEAFEPDDALISAVNSVLAALSAVPDFVGVDFLVDKESYIFNEIEDVVGTRMLYKTTETDAAMLFSQYIKKKMCAEANDV